jgi:hypothetical protein
VSQKLGIGLLWPMLNTHCDHDEGRLQMAWIARYIPLTSAKTFGRAIDWMSQAVVIQTPFHVGWN